MSIVVLALGVVGGIVYILFVLLSYSSESARLSQTLDMIRIRLEGAEKRLEEYENRVAALQEELPKQRARCERLERWIGLLKDQKARVEAEKKAPKEMSGEDERREAVRKGLTTRRRGKGE